MVPPGGIHQLALFVTTCRAREEAHQPNAQGERHQGTVAKRT